MRRIAASLGMVLVLVAGSRVARANKDRQTAQLLSGVGAGASGALVVASFVAADDHGEINYPLFYVGAGTSVITPSLGEWYAGQWLTIGMGVRIAAAGLATYAVRTQQKTVTCDYASMAGQECKALKGAGIALLGVAAIAYVGGAWYDALDAGDAVDRHNRAHAAFVTATVLPGPRGLAPGLAVGGTF